MSIFDTVSGIAHLFFKCNLMKLADDQDMHKISKEL